MKSWHIGMILILVAVYAIGALYPAPFNVVRGKLGM